MNMKNKMVICAVSVALSVASLQAVDYDVNANGAWDTTTTWTPTAPTGGPTTGDTLTFDSGFSGTRTITVNGAAANIDYFVGSISFNDTNTIVLQSNGNSPILNITGNVSKSSSGTLTFNQNGGNLRVRIGGNLSVDGGIANFGTGTGTSNRVREFLVNGTTSISSGATVNINTQGGTTNLSLGAATVNGSINLTGSDNNRYLNFYGLSGSGSITDGSTSTTNYVRFNQATGSATYSGTIGQSSTSLIGVSMNGAGTQILSGTNTYTGTTSVSAGTLLINGDQSAATGAVTVSTGATLGGTGIIGGATAVNTGGFLAPATLDFSSNLSLAGGVAAAGATAIFEGGDLVNVGGTLTLIDGWNLTLGNGFQDGGTVTLFDYDTAGVTFSLLADIDVSGLGFTPTSSLFLTDTGSSIVLNGISAIPEPGTYALVLGGLAVLIALRRARRAS